jgi:tetratricopeptide (TPR) repeat protein
LGDTYFSLLGNDFLPDSAQEEIERLENKALQLEPSLPNPHVTLAWLNIFSWKLSEAELQADRALQLDPNSVDAHVAQLWVSRIRGKMSIKAIEIEQLRQLDPVSPITLASLGTTLEEDDATLDDGFKLCTEAVQLDSSFALAHWCLGRAFQRRRDAEKAISEFRRAVAAGGGIPYFETSLDVAYALAGNLRPAIKRVGKLRSKKDRCWCYEIAKLEASIGNREAALYWLKKAFQVHDKKLIFIASEVEFRPLQADPEFQDLARALGLPVSARR